MEPSEVLRLKQALALDAANAAGDRESTAWLEPEQWKNYMGKETRKALYGAFPDEELLAVLRETAARLGRNPSKKEVFCPGADRRRIEEAPRAAASGQPKKE